MTIRIELSLSDDDRKIERFREPLALDDDTEQRTYPAYRSPEWIIEFCSAMNADNDRRRLTL